MNFDKIVGHTGHLVLSCDGAILSSGGDLGRGHVAYCIRR
jgi:hypothetical protein